MYRQSLITKGWGVGFGYSSVDNIAGRNVVNWIKNGMQKSASLIYNIMCTITTLCIIMVFPSFLVTIRAEFLKESTKKKSQNPTNTSINFNRCITPLCYSQILIRFSAHKRLAKFPIVRY